MSDLMISLNFFVMNLISNYNLEMSHDAMINLVLMMVLFFIMAMIYGSIIGILNIAEKIGNRKFAKYRALRAKMDNQNN